MPKQRAPRRAISLESLGLGIALDIVDMTIGNMKRADHPIAIEQDLLINKGWELRVRLHAIKCAVDAGWDFTLNFQIKQCRLKPRGGFCSLVNVEVGEGAGHNNILSIGRLIAGSSNVLYDSIF